MAARQDTQYLQKHGNQWRVRLKVPEALRPIIGTAFLLRPLHTDSLAVANREKLKHVIAMREELDRAAALARQRAKAPADPLVEEALGWQEALKAEDDAEGGAEVWYALHARADEIERAHGETKAGEFASIASGAATPIGSMVDTWLSERPLKPRQKADYRRAVTKFEAWMKALKLPATLEAATRKLAGRYVSEQFVKAGVNWKTANKDVSSLSGYWKWLVRKDFATEVIWREQSLPKLKKPKGQGKRPYTDEEIVRLFSGEPPKAYLKDAMMIAALSGMRVDEIARIKIGDISDGCIEITDAKTGAGERVVPIHPALVDLIERRKLERRRPKEAGEYLFHELPTPKADSIAERSQPIVKGFIYYRRKIGIDERIEDARQSRIDFHSFRRWFAASARNVLTKGGVGFTAWTLAEVMGHEREEMPLGMTMARYAGDDTMEAKRACVEAVRLPLTIPMSSED